MDDRRFDALVKTLATSGGPRRGILQALGAGALAAVFGRLGLKGDAEARKKRKNRKKKKCKGNTRKCNGKCIPQDDCCVNADCDAKEVCNDGACIPLVQGCESDADCGPTEVCQNGSCVDPDCQNNGDCGVNEFCQNGTCVNQQECQANCAANELCVGGDCQCVFPAKPCDDACCAEDESCFNGQCVVGQGTCAATADVCATGDVSACNGNANCLCAARLDGQARCIGAFLGTSCNCLNDFDCEQDFEEGAICIKGGPQCNCNNPPFGTCARLCPGSN